MSKLICVFLDDLTAESDLIADERDELELSLTEAMTNAFEHGCLGIDRGEKTRLQVLGEYEEVLAGKPVQPDATISLSASLWFRARKPLLIIEIGDNGPGIPDKVLSAETDETAVNGRGLPMISRFCDSLFVGGPGGRLIILKTLEGGCA
jgi:anti-sigma regulatory factor (Ser/Thr protein kinase)